MCIFDRFDRIIKNDIMNIGLNLLRILLTLGVVMDHFWWRPDPENLRGFDVALWQLRTLAVPAFMTMTFFFMAKRFVGSLIPGSFSKRIVE